MYEVRVQLCLDFKIFNTGPPDLHKTFVDDESYNSGHGHAYEFYGIDHQEGALAVVRPDQCM